MAHHTKEDCIRLGIPLAAIKHRMTRRATWKKYWREGTYGITIHLNEDADIQQLMLGQVVGNVHMRPRLEDFETHPNVGKSVGESVSKNVGENEAQSALGNSLEGILSPQSTSTETQAPHTQLSPLGRIVDHKIREIGTHQHEEDVTVTHHVVMVVIKSFG